MAKIKDTLLAGMAVVMGIEALRMREMKQEGSMEIEILGERFLVPQDIKEREVQELVDEKIKKDVEKVYRLWKNRGFKPFVFEGKYEFWASNKKAAEKKYIRWKEKETA